MNNDNCSYALTYKISDGAFERALWLLMHTAAVTFFSDTLNTLSFKTIEDTLLTVKQYEDARCAHDSLSVI